MALPRDLLAELARYSIVLHENEPLAKKTWWRVGGPADGYVEIGDVNTLVLLLRTAHTHGIEVFAFGNASNLLVSDLGIRGIVVRLVGEHTASDEEPDRRVKLGGGLKLTSLVRRMERARWTGLELFAGIPGTVGGAVRMNAGTKLGEVSDRLVEVEVAMPDGTLARLERADLEMGYRHAELPKGAIVLWARFQLTDDDPAESRRKIEEHLAFRAKTQPIDVPTCGSTFRNPAGDSAGRLIESCGLKGLVIGRAQVSEKHANFLVNLGGATAGDIRRLIESVQRRVEDQTGIRLVPEVHYAGDWSLWDPEATL
jgi:UDP-N-acetylmuramate dehydrogenase